MPGADHIASTLKRCCLNARGILRIVNIIKIYKWDKGIMKAHPKVFASLRLQCCSGLNDPLRQYFSLYRAVYQREGEKEYREANRRIQKAVKKAKEDWIGAQCEEIETCLNKNNSKRAYQLVKDLTSEKQGRSSTIQDKSGKCLTEEKEILSRWTEYCSELYN